MNYTLSDPNKLLPRMSFVRYILARCIDGITYYYTEDDEWDFDINKAIQFEGICSVTHVHSVLSRLCKDEVRIYEAIIKMRETKL